MHVFTLYVRLRSELGSTFQDYSVHGAYLSRPMSHLGLDMHVCNLANVLNLVAGSSSM